MAEQSHRQEMSAAIRAQRERQAAARPPAPQPALPTPERKSWLARLRGK